MRANATLVIPIVASIAIHAGTLAVAPARTATMPPAPTLVELEMIAPPPPAVAPPPPMPLATPVVATPKIVVGSRMPARAPRRSPAPPPDRPPALETPADLTGVTLTNDSGSWTSPTGNGERMTGAIGAPRTEVTSRGRPGAAATREAVAAAGDLSRSPIPPDLGGALAVNYPAAARTSGLRGRARVRVRIHANGQVGTLRLISQSAAGFGDACIATLRGSRWQPPLDAAGRAVATDVAYTCEFEVVR